VWIVVEVDVVEENRKMYLPGIPTLDSYGNNQPDLPLFRKQVLDGTFVLLFPIVVGRESFRFGEETAYRR
jgi:hypothetical protein